MKTSPYSLLKRSAAAVALSFSLIAIADLAQAQVPFTAPPVGAPGNREAGSARSDTCTTTMDSAGLTAVIPESNVGLTTKAFPTFFTYVPANNAQRAEFRLLEEDTGNEVYVGQVALPEADPGSDYQYAPALISLSMPADGSTVELESGKRYLWAFMLVCNEQNRAEDIVVTGVVQRPDASYFESLSPDIQDQLKTLDTAAPAEKLAVYGQAGIWQDLLEELASLTASDPAVYQNDWSTLLNEQGLGAIANMPIVFRSVEPL